MMTIEIKNRMYRNIALLIFLLLTAIVSAFANEKDNVIKRGNKVQVRIHKTRSIWGGQTTLATPQGQGNLPGLPR